MQIKPRPVITTRNLHEHSAQEVFDFVCLKVLEQGKPSMRGTGCAYRGEGGLKCAVGHLIRDEDYRKEFDSGYIVLSLCNVFDEGLGWTNKAHLHLLRHLQMAHDDADEDNFLPSFRRTAAVIAEQHHLDPHILDAAVPA
jgi:hypothetical protein